MQLGAYHRNAVVIFCVLLIGGGCASVTIASEGERRLASSPTYEERKDYFLWGLVGEHTVDVAAVCGNAAPRQLQTQITTMDALLTAITLGVYAPRSARIWCD